MRLKPNHYLMMEYLAIGVLVTVFSFPYGIQIMNF